MKIISRIFLLLSGFLLTVSTSMAATPLKAPATFTLEGSTIELSCTYENLRGQTLNAQIEPNPTSVDGLIIFNTIESATGIFTGSFEEITASVQMSTQVADTLPVTLILDAENVTGLFLWAADRVIFDTNNLNIQLEIKDHRVPVSLNGIKFPAAYKDNEITIQVETDAEATYLNTTFLFHIKLNLTGELIENQAATPWMTLRTDQPAYSSGQKLRLMVGMGNPGADLAVDIYLCLHTPDDRYLFFPAWTEEITPVLSSWIFPSATAINDAELLNIALPSQAPPVSAPGQYQFMAAMAVPGTFDFIDEIAVAEFSFSTQQSSQTLYDGHWSGKGSSSVVSGECPDLASVTMDIVNGQIVDGEGSDDTDDEQDSYVMTGSVDASGNIINGQLWEEFKDQLILMGTFSGTLNSLSGGGTWQDAYGCYGTFSIQKMQ